MDTVGWDGTVYPFVFPILNFSPASANMPSADGPRDLCNQGLSDLLFRTSEGRLRENRDSLPYPHSNVQVDEVIFYCDGDFTSRKGVGDGSVSFHPAGVPTDHSQEPTKPVLERSKHMKQP